MGLAGIGIAYVLYYLLVDKPGAVTAASATYFPPVVALFIGWFFVYEPIDFLDMVAMMFIVAGVFRVCPTLLHKNICQSVTEQAVF
ncbi:EamA/RhaT family transporter [Desulfonema ishimotonii]|uniref:EamA/RhaT family transporter n=1 Tax=Desulfonema ishimotonii TaxID=45657 RepID=A0A401G2I6_9BACT|nr:EamA family transporter [Desulfonema ishimotonii]GBC63426.1 EamA/RhaT family transporter [Desulfonema ishimotonii]